LQVQEIEYVKNCVVKYLESNDEKVGVLACILVFRARSLSRTRIAILLRAVLLTAEDGCMSGFVLRHIRCGIRLPWSGPNSKQAHASYLQALDVPVSYPLCLLCHSCRCCRWCSRRCIWASTILRASRWRRARASLAGSHAMTTRCWLTLV
jgi:hypothetical protein